MLPLLRKLGAAQAAGVQRRESRRDPGVPDRGSRTRSELLHDFRGREGPSETELAWRFARFLRICQVGSVCRAAGPRKSSNLVQDCACSYICDREVCPESPKRPHRALTPTFYQQALQRQPDPEPQDVRTARGPASQPFAAHAFDCCKTNACYPASSVDCMAYQRTHLQHRSKRKAASHGSAHL